MCEGECKHYFNLGDVAMKKSGLKNWYVVLLLSMLGPVSLAGIICVDPNSPFPDPNNPSSWTTAVHYLQDAIALAQPGDQVWVVKGTYTPDRGEGITPGDRMVYFALPGDVEFYGGFDGTESVLEERDWQLNETILSADLNGDDGPDFTNRSDNSWHVLTSNDATLGTILNGFTIRGGNPLGSFPHAAGGGLMIDGNNASYNGSMTIVNCKFTDNLSSAVWVRTTDTTFINCVFDNNYASAAGGYGAGIYYFGGCTGDIIDCTFTNNVATGFNAGIHLRYASTAGVLIEGCTFISNSATNLAAAVGLRDGASATISNCTFEENTCTGSGSAIALDSSAVATIKNCTIRSNTAARGAGIWLANSTTATVENCLFEGNEASWGGAVRTTNVLSATFKNCTFSGNTAPEGSKGGAHFADGYGSIPIDGCYYLNNDANVAGGALDLAGSNEFVIVNTIFAGNVSEGTGGAIFVDTDTVDAAISNCTFYGNYAADGGRVISLDPGSIVDSIDNCIIWETDHAIEDPDGNLAVNYCNILGGWTGSGTGNIDSDPLFVDVDGADGIPFTLDDDYHVLDTSPCIDAGNNDAVPAGITKDKDGNARIANITVDIGPYEKAGCGDEYHPIPVGDFNLDCRVNLIDLAVLADHWLICTAPDCD